MDRCMQLVYETEGQHGADIRGWNGREAQMWAEQLERDLAELDRIDAHLDAAIAAANGGVNE